ncbi:DNA-directed RNA polymerase I subunit RPA43 [Corythoichthys intestinalis]|uniref:DNA-directed RNA polymerase I subunit RPA43 n=1 Tax=Corythoichthys intestinalis TaxID=161448 RepID=UPI0025A5CF34|nr:DNA-directed RNA polymerase I subunit RPA43 [Corythoichthys intestinalis]XP_061808421.1 DNA-directed RNA polymerase I subunit RPA43 [Nerophis lumbriciformis]
MANLEHVENDPKHVKMSGETPEQCVRNPASEAPSSSGGVVVETPCTIPSFATASELVSAPYSCLVLNTHRRHVALSPFYLNKKRTGLQGELQAELLKFSPSLQGVPLAYDDIRIVRSYGDIFDDSGYVHMDIEANFIIFQPKKGQRLLGKVNKLAASHAGCLVHGCFNASIPKPNLVSVDTWREAGPQIGTELEFEVIALDADSAGVLLIRGRLDRTRVQEMLATAESAESGVAVEQAEPEKAETDAALASESVVEDAPKKKKRKKDKIKEETEDEVVSPPERNGIESDTKKKKRKKDKIKEVAEDQVDGDVTLELNGNESETNGGKKKKKKRIKEEKEQVQLSVMETHTSDSSGYLSDKPNKKRKREKESEVAASPDAEATKSKKKKKRKSEID